jgi:hypothetical protein
LVTTKKFDTLLLRETHDPTTRTLLSCFSTDPTFLLFLFCGNCLDPVDSENLAAKVPNNRDSHRHPIGIHGRTDIWSKAPGIRFCDLAREDITPITFAKRKSTPLRLAQGS